MGIDLQKIIEWAFYGVMAYQAYRVVSSIDRLTGQVAEIIVDNRYQRQELARHYVEITELKKRENAWKSN